MTKTLYNFHGNKVYLQTEEYLKPNSVAVLNNVRTFSITNYGKTYEVKLDWQVYRNNGTLALQLNNKPDNEDMEKYSQEIAETGDPFVEPYGVVTINMPESVNLPNDTQFVDANGSIPGIEKWLEENNIATPTDVVCKSSYCTYRAYKFNAPENAIQKVIDRKNEITKNQDKC